MVSFFPGMVVIYLGREKMKSPTGYIQVGDIVMLQILIIRNNFLLSELTSIVVE